MYNSNAALRATFCPNLSVALFVAARARDLIIITRDRFMCEITPDFNKRRHLALRNYAQFLPRGSSPPGLDVIQVCAISFSV